MINVSSEFHRLMNERTDFRQYAEMTLADGTQMVLTKEDFSVENNNVVDGAETSGIPLGVAVCRHIQIEIDNRDEKYSEVDFFGAKIRLYLTFQLSETEERIEYGTFTVLQPETYGETVIIYALDDMYKADKEYTSSLNYPATLKEILVDACSSIDISLGSTSFDNDDFVVDTKPTEITYRQLFGYVAMIAGGNARIDTTGRLRILTYNFQKVDSLLSGIMDGGKYFPWNNGSELEGGNFIDWENCDDADGGLFGDRKEFHLLNNWSTLKVDTDEIVITGVSTNISTLDGETEEIICGLDGYVLKVINPLMVGKEEEVLQLIGNIMIGGKMRKFSGDLVANPTCEFMDVAIVSDRKGNAYPTILTDINFQFFGFTVLSNSAESAMRNSSQTYSAAIETYVAAKKLVEQEKNDREVAIEQLAKDLQISSGLYMTEKEQADGSVIYYMHDKPMLEDSMIVWKLTANAFGVSTDGGKTYPYGFSVDGEALVKILYAEGINADYINSGALKIKDDDGNELFSVDVDKKSFSWNSEYSSMTNDGKLTANDVELKGNIQADSGSIGSFEIKDGSILYGKDSFTSNNVGIYIGTDGIKVTGAAGNFYVNLFDGYTYADTMNSINISTNGLQVTGDATMAGSRFSSYDVVLGGYRLGFFSSSGSAIQTVRGVSSYNPSVDDVANAINNLIGALAAYGLISAY